MITIHINDREARDALAELQRRVADMRQAMQEVAQAMEEDIRRRFIEQNAPDGTPWAPNSPVTLARFAEQNLSAKSYRLKDGSLNKRGRSRLAAKRILQGETGDLANDWRPAWGSDFAEVATRVKYAAVQHYGAQKGSLGKNAPWGDIPPRPFAGLSDDGKRTILQIIRIYLHGGR